MPIPVIFLALLVLAAVAGMVASGISGQRKLRRRVLDQFGRIPRGEEGPPEDAAAYAALDPREAPVDRTTWEDLDMDLVFRRVNACQSAVGEQVLYRQLHQLEPLPHWEGLLEHLEGRREEREALWLLLARLGKRKSGYCLPAFLFSPVEAPLFLGRFYPVFAWLPLAGLALALVQPVAGGCLLLASVCANVALYYVGKRSVQGDLDALRGLSALLGTSRRLAKTLTFAPLAGELEEALAPFRPLARRLGLLAPRGFSDLDLVREYLHVLTLGDLRLYRRAMGLLRAHPRELRRLFQAVGEVDAAVATLSFRATLPRWCPPDPGEGNALEFSGLYHPLLGRPVANDGSFEKDVLLTGSNASGKSTFLKALAVNAVLGQSLSTCAAARYRFRPGPVLTSMAVRDDITAGESYFLAEVRSLKRLADAARAGGCLLFIDEILKGTNTLERVAASQAVLEDLHHRDCLCVAATHDRELCRRLAGSYHSYHFREELTEEGVRFDYKLRPGPADTQNAIRLLGLLGFPGATVRRAEELAAQGGDTL